jgi:Family of unknown function (DUF5691)
MNPLVDVALAGTARQPNAQLGTGTPVDSLVERLAEVSRERRLLLAAGTWAIYRTAGRRAGNASVAPSPCPPESQPVCSAGASTLLGTLFGGDHGQLLLEALGRLQAAGCILPPELLPVALDQRVAERRAALLPVLGERGRWLARFNPVWAWAVEGWLPGDALPPDAETIWQEGSAAQRIDVFRRLRVVDPARSREWLRAVWKQEKADFRVPLIGALEEGLSLEDAPDLEAALDDRSSTVRDKAAQLLARLPQSAFAGRMRERADPLLSFAAGKLVVALPAACPKDWVRDSIVDKPPQGTGERAWWLGQLLSFVPPSHWVERFGAAPPDLIAAVQGDWAASVLQGWSKAALLHGDVDWMAALWDWWLHYSPDKTPKKGRKVAAGPRDAVPAQELLAQLPAAEAQRRAMQVLADPTQADAQLDDILNALPAPWSQQFGEAYLHGLRNHIATQSFKNWQDPWLSSLAHASTALPAACFAHALEPLPLPEPSDTRTASVISYWRNLIETFTETLRIRQRILEEIPA